MSGTAIVGIGARTPVGIGSAAAAAAIRAGITALAQHPFLVDSLGDMMPAAIDALLDAGLIGTERLLMLAETALSEGHASRFSRSMRRLRLAIYVGLPETAPRLRGARRSGYSNGPHVPGAAADEADRSSGFPPGSRSRFPSI